MDPILRHIEIRAEQSARRISGTVLAYGDVSPTHRERFEPGALMLAEAVTLNLVHHRMAAVAWYPEGGLDLEVTAAGITMTAQVPPTPAGNHALAEVRAGRLPGASVEFRALAERREGGLRVIERAELRGIGLVPDPSYKQSRVEARAADRRLRRLRWL